VSPISKPLTNTPIPPKQPLKSTHRHHVCCLEIRGSHVCAAHSSCAPDARRPFGELGANTLHSYNRYLTVAARVVRRSLKDDKRLAAEKRGESDLRFAKWEVRIPERGWKMGQGKRCRMLDERWERETNTNNCYRTASRARSRTWPRPTRPSSQRTRRAAASRGLEDGKMNA
jgi:hypothetical protein